jgi:DNA polymerase III delta prime subunit
MKGGDLFHAYIVGGERETAREHIERMLADCEIVTSGPDYAVTEHVSFTIDNARTLRAWQELLPVPGARKIYIVYADFITREAENALLKTFEEPAANTHIFFAIPKPEVLLPTLLSRVRVVMPVRKGTDAASDSADAKKFLAMSGAERIAYVAKLVEKSDDDEAAAEVRERTLALLDGLEKILAEFPQKNREKLESILQFKKYLYIPGAYSRLILETIALTI